MPGISDTDPFPLSGRPPAFGLYPGKDLGADVIAPSVFVPLDESLCRQKIDTIQTSFATQAGKRWFSDGLFRSLLMFDPRG